jgi:6,7-dimethyl-8-ribityllumazine synthase
MATTHKNLSEYDKNTVPSASDMKIGIVISEWNYQITETLARGALDTLVKHGAKKENIIVRHVPGSFELTLGSQFFAQYTDVDAVIAIGCVIRGETPHFDFICQGVTKGITDLNLKFDIPFIFGVLTTENIEQANDRAGGKYGNKGVEAAIAAIKMVALQDTFLEEADIDDYWGDDEDIWNEEDSDEEPFDDDQPFDEDDELQGNVSDWN